MWNICAHDNLWLVNSCCEAVDADRRGGVTRVRAHVLAWCRTLLCRTHPLPSPPPTTASLCVQPEIHALLRVLHGPQEGVKVAKDVLAKLPDRQIIIPGTCQRPWQSTKVTPKLTHSHTLITERFLILCNTVLPQLWQPALHLRTKLRAACGGERVWALIATGRRRHVRVHRQMLRELQHGEPLMSASQTDSAANVVKPRFSRVKRPSLLARLLRSSSADTTVSPARQGRALGALTCHYPLTHVGAAHVSRNTNHWMCLWTTTALG